MSAVKSTAITNGITQYPAGHASHLSVSQSQALDEFKRLAAVDGYYIAANSTQPASHDDETLLRFLRARKFNPEDAFQQFKNTEEWRLVQEIDDTYDRIDVDEYDETRRLYTMWTGRRDKLGFPLYIFDIGALPSHLPTTSPSHSTSNTTLTPHLRRLFATYEHLTTFVLPLCTTIPTRPYPSIPISQTTCIVDISRTSIRQFWALKSHLQTASALATAHYPETLGRTFIVGAPGWFPTVWSWVRGWFDKGTVEKIHVLGAGEVEEGLAEWVDKENLPRRYGGELEWEFGDLPVLESEVRRVFELMGERETIDKGPIRWVEGEDGRLEARAVGSVNGRRRDELVGHLEKAAS